MRRFLYLLVPIAVLVFALSRCWRGSQQDPRQIPHNEATAAQPIASVAAAVLPSSASATPAPSAATSAEAVTDDEPLLHRLHTLEATNPRLASSLALQDRERFPNSPDAEERDMVLVTALHNQRDLLGAQREAWYYFMHYPDGQFTDYVSKLSGITPPKERPKR